MSHDNLLDIVRYRRSNEVLRAYMTDEDGSYGPQMFINSFFSDAPWPKKEEIGGWFFSGHDANDKYQEFILKGPFILQDDLPIDNWIDWTRFPIPKGNVLLK